MFGATTATAPASAAAHAQPTDRPAAYCGKTPLVSADADGRGAAHVNVGCGVRRGYTQTEIRGGGREEVEEERERDGEDKVLRGHSVLEI